ncbi:MAG: RlmE family RNA methyltransferase [Myxococcota bacterium]
MTYKSKDRFYKQAKNDRYAARSVYKLEELDRRYGLFKKGQQIIDLGCAPGSWMQYVAGKIGKKGLLLGYDIVPSQIGVPLPSAWRVANVHELTATDILAALYELRHGEPPPDSSHPPPMRIDALISDMAPKLTGIRDADQAKSVELQSVALALADALVKPGGFFVAKLFQGRDTDEFVRRVKSSYKEAKLLKPEATREGSREVFLLARSKRTPVDS